MHPPIVIDITRRPQLGDMAAFSALFLRGRRWTGWTARRAGLFWTPNEIPHPISLGNGTPDKYAFDHFEDTGLPANFHPPGPRAQDVYDTLAVDLDYMAPEQMAAMLAPLRPNAVVVTGDFRYGERGRGVHAFWRLAQPITALAWTCYQLNLIGHLNADPCVLSPWQPLRVGGYPGHGRVQTLVHLDSSGPLVVPMQPDPPLGHAISLTPTMERGFQIMVDTSNANDGGSGFDKGMVDAVKAILRRAPTHRPALPATTIVLPPPPW
jgi:hypothetical protein